VGLEQKYSELLDDKSENIQMAGIQAAVKLENRKVAPKIHAILKGRPQFSAMDKVILWKTKGNEEKVRNNARIVKALIELGYSPVIDEIVARKEFMSFNGVAGGLIAQFGVKGLPKLLELARDNDSNKKAQGRSGIMSVHDEAAVKELIKLLNDSDKKIVTASLFALKRMPRDLRLNDGDEKKVLKGIVLKQSDLETIEKSVAPMLKDSDRTIKTYALSCLLSFRPQKYLPVAAEAMKGDRQTGVDIIYDMISYKIVDAVPYLEELIRRDELEQPNLSNLRALAAKAIFALSGKKVPYKGVERDTELYNNPYELEPTLKSGK
jgi:hypothetical protein